jgi:hypothetical protein
MTDPYPHPLHMKVVNHLAYVWDGSWEPFYVGLEPQPMHKGSFYTHQQTKISADFPKLWPTSVVVSHNMMTDPYPHPLHMKVVNHLAYVWDGCGHHSMWVCSIIQCIKSSFGAKQQTKISADFPKLQLTWVVVTARWWVRIPIHCIWRLSITLHMCALDVGTIPCGFGASTNAWELILHSSANQDLSRLPKIVANKCSCNNMMTDPYPHPLLMIVANHIAYVWDGCCNHSMWVWSLNQCIRAHFTLISKPRFQLTSQNCSLHEWW